MVSAGPKHAYLRRAAFLDQPCQGPLREVGGPARRHGSGAWFRRGVGWLARPQAYKLVISRPGELLDEARAQELVEWLVISGHTIARVLSKYL